MSLNKFMHPRNRYKDKRPDFEALSRKYPLFKQHAHLDERGKTVIDFKDAEALRALTMTLLAEDFGMKVDLPRDRLTPTVPLRLNYIHWLEDILGREKDNVTGIDIAMHKFSHGECCGMVMLAAHCLHPPVICRLMWLVGRLNVVEGTGACCIYPLLGCCLNKWSFVATETDETTCEFAKRNVEQNNLQDKITVMLVGGESILTEAVQANDQVFDFCMCNPPFFGDSLEAQGLSSSRNPDRPTPPSASTAQPQEAICLGGEVNFVAHMINESLQMKDRVRVYTSMLGKKASLGPLKAELHRNGIENFGTTEFCQGRTMRWGIGWSFDKTTRFPKSSFQEKKKQNKERLPIQFTVPRNLPGMEHSVPQLLERVTGFLSDLQIRQHKLKCGETGACLRLTAWENTWLHQRRKRREKMRAETAVSPSKTPHLSAADAETEGTAPAPGQGEKVPCDVQTSDAGATSTPSSLRESGNAYETDPDNDKSEEKLNASALAAGSEKNSQGVEGDVACKSVTPKGTSGTPRAGGEGRKRSGKSTFPPILKCWLRLKRCADDILLEMEWIDGENKELMHQVLQHFKNRLAPPPAPSKTAAD